MSPKEVLKTPHSDHDIYPSDHSGWISIFWSETIDKKNINNLNVSVQLSYVHGLKCTCYVDSQRWIIFLNIFMSRKKAIYICNSMKLSKLETLIFWGWTIPVKTDFALHYRQLRKFNQPQELLKQFSAIIETVLCTSITVWFSSATKSELRRLQRVIQTAERNIGTTLLTLQELYLSRVSKRACKITLDPSHPAQSLF